MGAVDKAVLYPCEYALPLPDYELCVLFYCSLTDFRGHAEDLGVNFDYEAYDSVLFIRFLLFSCFRVVETERSTSFLTESYPEMMPERFYSPAPLPSFQREVKTHSLAEWAQTAISPHCTAWLSEKRVSTTVSASKTGPKSAAIPSRAVAGESSPTW